VEKELVGLPTVFKIVKDVPTVKPHLQVILITINHFNLMIGESCTIKTPESLIKGVKGVMRLMKKVLKNQT
jgi:hypothetical protein